jgi:hypothetical protein
VCNRAFSKVEEIVSTVGADWSPNPHGKEGYRVEEDWMGDKWRTIEKRLANPLNFWFLNSELPTLNSELY